MGHARNAVDYCNGTRQSSYIEHGDSNPVFDQRGELPLLPVGNPNGFVPASIGGIYIESRITLLEPFKGPPIEKEA